MARQYPRFLFSNPTNTKSKGPFVIHTLEPRLIFKVHHPDTSEEEINLISEKTIVVRTSEGSPYLELLDPFPDTDKAKVALVDAILWIDNQYYNKKIQF